MEKEQYKDHYMPFAKSKLVITPDFLKGILGPTGKYQSLLNDQKIFFRLFSKILKIGEKIIGTTFSFEKSDQDFPLSLKWLPIINYLKENKVIEDIYFEPLYHDEPKIFKTKIVAPLDTNLTDGHQLTHFNYTHGDSFDIEEAISKVVGEFLERYPLVIYRDKNFYQASLNDLKNKRILHLDIDLLAGFSKEQKYKDFRFQFDENSNFLWTKGRSLFTNKDVLIPAQLIFWNYNHAHQGWREPILLESNTNGAGGHYSLNRAILSGFYELIQRDGLFIYWLNNQSPPQISIKNIDEQLLKDLLDECRRLDFEIRFYNTTTEINIPSCLCTVFDHSGEGPKLSMGGGCDTNWEKMLLRSLIEALGVYHWMRNVKVDQNEDYLYLDKDYRPFSSSSINQKGRLSFWSNPKNFKYFQFFLEGKTESLEKLKERELSFSSDEETLNYMINKFKSLGKEYEVFYYQADHQILKELGYFSAKVIIPALVPLYLNEPYAVLEAKRLKEVPSKLGFKPAKKWNPWPHPFP